MAELWMGAGLLLWQSPRQTAGCSPCVGAQGSLSQRDMVTSKDWGKGKHSAEVPLSARLWAHPQTHTQKADPPSPAHTHVAIHYTSIAPQSAWMLSAEPSFGRTGLLLAQKTRLPAQLDTVTVTNWDKIGVTKPSAVSHCLTYLINYAFQTERSASLGAPSLWQLTMSIKWLGHICFLSLNQSSSLSCDYL